MKKSDELKEKIIEVTTEMIINSNGAIERVTTRSIAEKADIGVGLINYHFQTKENLVEICVQRIIGNVISNFRPNVEESLDDIDRLKRVAKMVADFLINNEAVSYISILGDCKSPRTDDNTVKTAKGFSMALGQCEIPYNEKSILTFALTAVMQSIFLRKNMSFELFNLNFNDKKDRDLFLDFLIDRLFVTGRNNYE
jgi:AcrR family transcriptional regulator